MATQSATPDADQVVELTVLTLQPAYLYVPIPPAASYGHRAELWNVDKWARELKLRMVSVGDELIIKLEEPDTGELFVEAPLPCDGSPLTRVVEPVVDSSRYYVLRVENRQEPRKHAFVGLGFRERNQSSDFSASLDEYRQYLRRKAEAEAMRAAYAAGSQGGGDAGPSEGGGGGGGHSSRFSLQAGQTISLKLPGAGGGKDGVSRLVAKGVTADPAVRVDPSTGVLSIPPPPPPSPGASSVVAALMRAPSGAPARVAQQQDSEEWDAFNNPKPDHVPPASIARSPMRTSGEAQFQAPRPEEDEWGEFQ